VASTAFSGHGMRPGGASRGQAQLVQPLAVVCECHQAPLAGHLVETAQREPGEAEHRLDDAEDLEAGAGGAGDTLEPGAYDMAGVLGGGTSVPRPAGRRRSGAGIAEAYVADWTMEQFRDAVQRIADRIDEINRSGGSAHAARDGERHRCQPAGNRFDAQHC